jgi:hypothetical protein
MYLDMLSWKSILKFVYLFGLFGDLLQTWRIYLQINTLSATHAVYSYLLPSRYSEYVEVTFFHCASINITHYWNIWHLKVTYPCYVLRNTYQLCVG